MKSNRIDGKPDSQSIEYPYLAEFVGEGNGPFVVLFTDFGVGTVVHTENDQRPLGEFAKDWTEGTSDFTPFEGDVILSN